MNTNLNMKNKSTLSLQDIKIIERYSSQVLPDHMDEANARVAASFWNEYGMMPNPDRIKKEK